MNIKKIPALFLDNIGTRQTVIKNTFWLAVAELISRLLEFILIIYIIRILGVTEFGKFVFASALVSIFIVIFDLGLSDITTRELSNDKDAEKDYSAIFSLKIILSVIAMMLIIATSFLITQDPLTRLIIWILGLFVLVNDLFSVIYSFFRARQKMEFEAAVKILRSLILIFFVFFVLFKAPSIKNVSYGYLFSNLLALILVLLFFHFKIYSLKLDFNAEVWKKFIKISWPLGLAAISGIIIISIDSIIMGYLGQVAENGWYNASRKITSAIVMIATFIFMSFYPLLSKLFAESREKLQRVWNYYLETMVVLAFPIMSGGFFLASEIINVAFGQNFGPSVVTFQILIFVVGISFVCYPFSLILIISHQQKKYFWINFIAALINVLANIILIPLYSLYGAAIASLVTYIVLLVLSIYFSGRFTPISIFNARIFKIFLMSISASLIMLFLINQLLIWSNNIILNVSVGTFSYFGFLFLFYYLFKEFNPFLIKVIKK